MTEIKYKVIERKRMKEQSIGQWLKPHKYNLYIVDVSCSLYGLNLQLCFGPMLEFSRYIKEKHDREVDHENAKAMYCWYTVDGIQNKYLILTENEWGAEDYGTMAHEVHHVVSYSLADVGISHSKDSEEAYAYFQGYLMERVIRAFVMLNKSLSKRRKKK